MKTKLFFAFNILLLAGTLVWLNSSEEMPKDAPVQPPGPPAKSATPDVDFADLAQDLLARA